MVSKNIKILGNIILAVVLYGRVTSSLTVREERRMRVVKNSLLTRIFGRERDGIIRGWRKLLRKELFIQVIKIDKNENGVKCTIYAGEVYTEFWWGNMKEGDQLEDPGVDGGK